MEILNFIEVSLREKQDVVFLELGCCDGYHTKQIHQILKNATKSFKYYGLEMVKVNYSYCLSQVAHLENMNLFNLAIGAKTENNREFYFSNNPSFCGSSSIKPPKKTLEIWKDLTFVKDVCNVISLDDFCINNNIDHIDFIWADLQGAEAEMIAGGKDAFKKVNYLYTEYFKDLHEGSLGLAEIMSLLPDFELIYDFNGDALLKNKMFNI